MSDRNGSLKVNQQDDSMPDGIYSFIMQPSEIHDYAQ